MLSLFHRRKQRYEFKIDSPEFVISSNTADFLSKLKGAGITYQTITTGYIVFEGRAFHSRIPLMIGVHFNAQTVEYIEIFRPLPYYKSPHYDINSSFHELSNMLKQEYGQPLAVKPGVLYGLPSEKWHTEAHTIHHYIIDRFGLEEHLHIYFSKSST